MQPASIPEMTLPVDRISEFVDAFLKQLQPGDWVWLDGDLGAGKTTFVQLLAKRLGVSENVVSPTFSLMNVYAKLQNAAAIEKLIHLDLYRIKKGSELLYVGLEQEASRQVVVLIEWPTQVDDDAWNEFFQATGCVRPLRSHHIGIEIIDAKTRCYSCLSV